MRQRPVVGGCGDVTGGHTGNGAAELAGGRECPAHQVLPRERAGGIVNEHDVDAARLDVGRQVTKDVELRGVPRVATLDEFDGVRSDFGLEHALGDGALAAPEHQDRPVDLGGGGHGAYRPGHHAPTRQR